MIKPIVNHPEQTKANSASKKARVGVRLIAVSIITSLLISVFFITVHIQVSYQQYLSDATSRFIEIENSYLEPLADRLWEVNEPGALALLNAIAQLPDVGTVTFVDELGAKTLVNQQPLEGFKIKNFAVQHVEDGKIFNLGQLQIELIDAQIAAKVKAQAQQSALIIALALLVHSIVALFLLHRMIIRHIIKMAKHVALNNVHELGEPLTLNRIRSQSNDELTQVVNALNSSHHRVHAEWQQRVLTEQDLLDHKKHLEQTVEQRTHELKTGAMQLEFAAKVAQLGVWCLHLDSGLLEWNEQMFTIYGQPHSLMDKPLNLQFFFDCLHPEDLNRLQHDFQQAIEDQVVFETQFRAVRPNGAIRYIQVRAQVVDNGDHAPNLVIGINHDITNHIEHEKTLQLAKHQADEANAAKSIFLANMSHEIRTPMNAVLGMLQLVQKTELNKRQQDYLFKAHSAAHSLLGLLNDILDYSKIEAGKLALDYHPFVLQDVLQDLAIVLTGYQAKPEVETLFYFDSQLPTCVVGDAMRLKQILINLMGNALKFTKEGEVIVSVNLLDQMQSHVSIRFSVTDTGIGINTEQRQRIFAGFTQAEASTTRRFGGTGLGLAISKKLAELMDSSLELTSEIGKGSSFWFDVKLAIEQQEPETSIPKPPSQKVLIVDDNVAAAEILAATCVDLGWQVAIEHDGIGAIENFEKTSLSAKPYDLILLDYFMPNMDGLSVARKLNAKFTPDKYPVIIMVTAHGQEEILDIIHNERDLFFDMLSKPLLPQQLLKMVNASQLKNSNSACLNAPEPQTETPLPLKGLHLLVVDDNEFNRDIAFGLLAAEGATVDLACGGLEAVNKVTDALINYDLVIMDIQMPDIDGLEATRRIRANRLLMNLPILAMTANVTDADKQMCLAAGMNGHVGKPFNLDELIETILQLTRRQVMKVAPSVTKEDVGQLIESWESIMRRYRGKKEIFVSLLPQFEPEVSGLLEKLISQFNAKNIAEMAATMHSIKGVAAAIGAAGLAKKTSMWEQHLKTLEADKLDDHFHAQDIDYLRDLLLQSLKALTLAMEQEK